MLRFKKKLTQELKKKREIKRAWERGGGEVKREVCVVSCSDVCLDQNRSEQHCLRQWAGGCHWCVNMCVFVWMWTWACVLSLSFPHYWPLLLLSLCLWNTLMLFFPTFLTHYILFSCNFLLVLSTTFIIFVTSFRKFCCCETSNTIKGKDFFLDYGRNII